MKHFRIIEKRMSGIIYTGLCGNTEAEALEAAKEGFPQYSNMKAIECNCESWNGTDNIPEDWIYPEWK